MGNQIGFSLVELMIAIVILGVILGIGVPSMQSWLVSAQVTAKSEAILNGLQLARAEALRRNTRVYFNLNQDSSWTVGCVNAVGDTDGDGLADCPDPIQSKSADEAGKVDDISLSPFGATMVSFNGIGLVVANAGGGGDTLTQVDIAKSGGGVTRNLRIIVTLGGQSRLCDPDIEVDGDPKKC
jgi:type IV fimbrial biogenesis protein FimT